MQTEPALLGICIWTHVTSKFVFSNWHKSHRKKYDYVRMNCCSLQQYGWLKHNPEEKKAAMKECVMYYSSRALSTTTVKDGYYVGVGHVIRTP